MSVYALLFLYQLKRHVFILCLLLIPSSREQPQDLLTVAFNPTSVRDTETRLSGGISCQSHAAVKACEEGGTKQKNEECKDEKEKGKGSPLRERLPQWLALHYLVSHVVLCAWLCLRWAVMG